MSKVFIGGSRMGLPTGELPIWVINKLTEYQAIDTKILVGDAAGVDKAVQFKLKADGYKNVQVFTVLDKPRNYLDKAWLLNIVPATSSIERERQSFKDLAMAKEATEGLMVWNDIYLNRFGKTSVSSGTLQNMIKLLALKKPLTLFYIPKGEAIRFSTESDLDKFISNSCSESTKKYYSKNLTAFRQVSIFDIPQP